VAPSEGVLSPGSAAEILKSEKMKALFKELFALKPNNDLIHGERAHDLETSTRMTRSPVESMVRRRL